MGNIGDWSPVIRLGIDDTLPVVKINPLSSEWISAYSPNWTGSAKEPYAEKSFNISWELIGGGEAVDSGLDCFELQWNTSSLGWTNILNDAGGTCISPDTTFEIFGNGDHNDPANLADGEIYSFRVRGIDKVGNIGQWSTVSFLDVSATIVFLFSSINYVIIIQNTSNYALLVFTMFFFLIGATVAAIIQIFDYIQKKWLRKEENA